VIYSKGNVYARRQKILKRKIFLKIYFSSGFKSLCKMISELATTFLYLDIQTSLFLHLNNIQDSLCIKRESKSKPNQKHTQKKANR